MHHHLRVMEATDMRSLSRDARHERRVQVIRLRKAGGTYDEIAAQTGLSRTGVFDLGETERLMKEAGYERDSAKFWAKDGKRATRDTTSELIHTACEPSASNARCPPSAATLWHSSSINKGLPPASLSICCVMNGSAPGSKLVITCCAAAAVNGSR
mgnify:CR=1 FL=1